MYRPLTIFILTIYQLFGAHVCLFLEGKDGLRFSLIQPFVIPLLKTIKRTCYIKHASQWHSQASKKYRGRPKTDFKKPFEKVKENSGVSFKE